MPAPASTATRTMASRMGLLSAGTLLSRILGMLRETLLAATFDVGATDAFFIAWRIPNALRALLAEGALSAAFVPVFSATLVRGEEAFAPGGRLPRDAAAGLTPEERAARAVAHRAALRAVVARVRGLSLAVLAALTLLGMVFARPVLRALAGDFGGDTARFDLAVDVLRILFPYIFFMGSSAVGIGVLQSLGRYTAPAFAPALLNVAFLIAPFAFVPLCVHLGYAPIHGMALGALLGGALQLLALVPALHREGMLPAPRIDLAHPAVRRIGALLGPVTFGLAIYQIDVLLSNRFLAALPRGATSFFNYAQRLADIPQGIFVLAISSAVLPELARAVSAGDRSEATRLLGWALRVSAFVAVPVAVLLAAYGEAIVPLVFGYGRFRALGPGGVHEVVRSLRWQAANVALLAFVRQLLAAFSAAQDTRTPVLVSALDLGAYVLLALLLRGPLGHAGVAAAITGSTAVQLALLLALVHRRVALPWSSVLPALARILAASAVVGVGARALVAAVAFDRPGLTPRLLAITGGAALGTVYLLLAWVLRIEEVRQVTAALRRKLPRRPAPSTP